MVHITLNKLLQTKTNQVADPGQDCQIYRGRGRQGRKQIMCAKLLTVGVQGPWKLWGCRALIFWSILIQNDIKKNKVDQILGGAPVAPPPGSATAITVEVWQAWLIIGNAWPNLYRGGRLFHWSTTWGREGPERGSEATEQGEDVGGGVSPPPHEGAFAIFTLKWSDLVHTWGKILAILCVCVCVWGGGVVRSPSPPPPPGYGPGLFHWNTTNTLYFVDDKPYWFFFKQIHYRYTTLQVNCSVKIILQLQGMNEQGATPQ